MKRLSIIVFGACFLQACETRTDLAPVYSVDQISQEQLHPTQTQVVSAPTNYTVLPGENLYTIAKRFNMDYHQLAKLNNINPPYYIHAGEILMISKGGVVAQTQVPTTQKFEYTPTLLNTAKAVRSTAVTQGEPLPPAVSANWIWPVSAGVVKHPFSAQINGMDIRVASASPVYAAQKGTVLYVGEAISGEDQMVIIKHNGDFLTAYSHLSNILVKEGELVKMGQKIARLSKRASGILHFDMRYRGSSVNPVDYVTVNS